MRNDPKNIEGSVHRLVVAMGRAKAVGRGVAEGGELAVRDQDPVGLRLIHLAPRENAR